MRIELQLLMLRGIKATKPTTRPLYKRGEYPPITAPALPTVEQAATREAQRRATEKVWGRPRCIGGCLSIVIVHRDTGDWHCSNMACGRMGFTHTVGGVKVRVVDNEGEART